MNDYEKIYDYLESSLEPEEEQQLFARISADSELRDFFGNTIRINTSLKENDREILPPDSLKGTIFSSLGLSGDNPEIKEAPVKSKLSKRYLLWLLPLLLASIFIYDHYESKLSGLEDQVQALNQKLEEQIKMASKTLVQDKQTVNSQVAIKKSIPQTDNKEKYNAVINKNDSFNSIRSEGCFINPSSAKFSSKIMKVSTPATDFQNYYQSYPMISNLLALSGPDSTGPFSLEIGGIFAGGIQNYNFAANDFGPLHDNLIGINYSMDENWNIGLIFRREEFLQEFTGHEADSNFRYKQEQTLTSLDFRVLYKTAVLPYSDFYLAGSGGINTSGFVFRGSFGLDIKAMNNITFRLGYNYSRLFFKYQGNSFQSDKSGLQYSILYRF